MSQYAEVEDMVLGLQSDSLTDVDEAVIIRHLVAASALADSYISGRGYPFPLVSWGEDLRGAVVRIASWTLINARGVNPNNPGHAAIKMAHDDAVSWLRDVAKGIANIDVATTTPARTTAPLMQVFRGDDDTDRGW